MQEECTLLNHADQVDPNLLKNTFDYTVLRFKELVTNREVQQK